LKNLILIIEFFFLYILAMRFFSSSLALSAALFGGCNDPAKQSPAGDEASTSVSVGTSSSSVNSKSSDPAVVGGKVPSRRALALHPPMLTQPLLMLPLTI
jgi:hypothetical protein